MTEQEKPLPPRHVKTYSVPVEKDSEGFPLCRWCKTSIRFGKRPKQRTFCQDKNCLHEWKLRSDPGYAAEQVLKRDRGVCAGCGLHCLHVFSKLLAIRGSSDRSTFTAYCDEIGLPDHLRTMRRRLWEMDHIVPVVEGGGLCGMENLRTLCFKCHRKETRALAGRRADSRKKAA